MRHGEGVDDVEDRYGGWGDLPLSKKGRKQAENSIVKIEKFDIDLVLSSPLKRAMETAEIIACGCKLKAEKWLYLKERNTYGLMSGEVKSDVKENYPELHDAYENDDYLPGAESYKNLIKRMRVMIEKVKTFEAEKILAVTHGKFLSAFCKEFLGKEIDKKENCCILEIELQNDKIEFVTADGMSFK